MVIINWGPGALIFADDGTLLIGNGDGSMGKDADRLARNATSLWGKILRIDVDGKKPYGIPPG